MHYRWKRHWVRERFIWYHKGVSAGAHIVIPVDLCWEDGLNRICRTDLILIIACCWDCTARDAVEKALHVMRSLKHCLHNTAAVLGKGVTARRRSQEKVWRWATEVLLGDTPFWFFIGTQLSLSYFPICFQHILFCDNPLWTYCEYVVSLTTTWALNFLHYKDARLNSVFFICTAGFWMAVAVTKI